MPWYLRGAVDGVEPPEIGSLHGGQPSDGEDQILANVNCQQNVDAFRDITENSKDSDESFMTDIARNSLTGQPSSRNRTGPVGRGNRAVNNQNLSFD